MKKRTIGVSAVAAALILAVVPARSGSAANGIVNIFFDDGSNCPGSSNSGAPYTNLVRDVMWNISAAEEPGLLALGAVSMDVRMIGVSDANSHMAYTNNGLGMSVAGGGDDAWLDGLEAVYLQPTFYADNFKWKQLKDVDITFKSIIARMDAASTNLAVNAYSTWRPLAWNDIGAPGIGDEDNVKLGNFNMFEFNDTNAAVASDIGIAALSVPSLGYYTNNSDGSVVFDANGTFWLRRENLNGASDGLFQLGAVTFDVERPLYLFKDMIGASGSPDRIWAFAGTADESLSLNTNHVARQAGGTVTSTYTVDSIAGGSGVRCNEFGEATIIRTKAFGGAVVVDLDTNFGSYVENAPWTLSCTELITGQTNGLVGFSHISVGSPADVNTANGITLSSYGNGVIRLYVNGTQVNAGDPIAFLPPIEDNVITYDLTFDEVADTVSVNITVGTIPYDAGTWTTAFADGDRYIEKKAHQVAGGLLNGMIRDHYLVDLSIKVEPHIEPIGNIAQQYLPGTGLELTWNTTDGYSYTLLERENLIAGGWLTNETDIAGTGGDVSRTDTVTEAQSFYKVTGE